ncbi:hypothetical protein ACJJTC_001415 [Scirpophaga incertulas]
MVSHFEAEAQDELDDLAIPVPDEEQSVHKVSVVATYTVPGVKQQFTPSDKKENKQQLSIEVSLTKLFKCMTLAYRQKLTSPKWNRFKGIKLRWKDKIRLNNVIWRCWHMQFIKRQNTLVCQFASPLDVDTHVKPETTILEGKYWKRRAEAVIAEYKKWRMFHIMRLLGKGDATAQDTIMDMDTVESFSQCSDLAGNMLTDEDYLSFMSDTLFSTISNHQPFAFPDCREIARGASLADFIQPSLGPLQPNLDDFMDTLEPLQELLSATPRLPPVPEESALPADDALYRGGMSVDTYSPQGYIASTQSTSTAMPTSQMSIHVNSSNAPMLLTEESIKNEQMRAYDGSRMYTHADVPGSTLIASDVMPAYAASYEQDATQMPGPLYGGKQASMQMTSPKIISQSEPYYTFNAVPPSQTAPETVTLLQQPVQGAKFSLARGFGREKASPRPRVAHFGQYQSYSVPPSQPSYEPRSMPVRQLERQSSPQMQYLQPAEVYKPKSAPPNTTRSFKMPSPPLATPQQQTSPGSTVTSSRISQEQYRSHSLPLGSHLNADWSLSHQHQHRHASRPREIRPSTRIRSRSTSGGAAAEGSPAGNSSATIRHPPPLNSVASEPSLPQASVMLAQLLSAQHSKSFYKLNNAEDASPTSDPTRSPLRRGQPSPIGSDVMSPHQSLSPPTSPGSPRAGSPRGAGEPRRTHLHAEQKRRYNIKNGFDTLQSLIPHLNTNPAAKISKAAMLQKGAEYIKQLKAERNQIKEEMESLRQQTESLNNSISNCHSLLPATGAPVSRARAGRLREMFARHVAHRSVHNWKYWLFSVVAAALVDSFSACVSCGSGADLVRTTLLWAEQHCSLVEMRPAVLNSLRVLCTTTDILSNPERLPEEARQAVAANASVKTEPT